MSDVARLSVTIGADPAGLTRGLREAQTKIDSFVRTSEGRLRDARGRFAAAGKQAGEGFSSGLTQGFKPASSAILALKGPLLAAGAALTGLGAIALKTGISFNAMKEQALVSFGVLLRDGNKAKALLADLQRFGDTTPFRFGEVATAAKLFLSFGFQLKDVNGLLRDAGDLAAGMNANIEDVARALGRLKSGDFGEAFERFRDFGIDRDTLEGKGLVFDKSGAYKGSVEQALGAVRSIIEERFAGMTQKQAETFNGLLSTLQDTATAKLGKLFEPLFEGAKPALRGLIAELNNSENAFSGWKDHIRSGLNSLERIWAQHKDAVLGISGSQQSQIVKLTKFMFQQLAGVFNTGMAAIEGDWANAWAQLQASAERNRNSFLATVKGAWELTKQLAQQARINNANAGGFVIAPIGPGGGGILPVEEVGVNFSNPFSVTKPFVPGIKPPASAGAGAAPSRASFFEAIRPPKPKLTGGGKGAAPSIDLPLTGQDTTATVKRMLEWLRDVEQKTQAMLVEAKDRLRQAADKTMGTSAFFDQAGRLIIPVDVDLLIQQGLEDPTIKAARDAAVLKPLTDLGESAKAAFLPVKTEWERALEQMALDMDNILGRSMFDLFTGRWEGLLGEMLRSFRDAIGAMAVTLVQAALGDKLFYSTGASSGGGVGGFFKGLLGNLIGVGLGAAFGGGLPNLTKSVRNVGGGALVPIGGGGIPLLPTGRASGGPVTPGGTFLVGENGPELLFMGSTGGYVANNRQSQQMLSGQPVNITIIQNISTRDAQSFRQSQSQIAAESYAAAQREWARNG